MDLGKTHKNSGKKMAGIKKNNLSNIKKASKFSLDASKLKNIAFISMIIDHITKAFLLPLENNSILLNKINFILLAIGRIAFPIFLFLLVEGFFKTKSTIKYLRNLFIGAILSEIPFNLFLTGTIHSPKQNMLFTLSFCLLMLIVIDKSKKMIENKYIHFAFSILMANIFAILVIIANTDYDYKAILITYIMYLFYNKKILSKFLSYLVVFSKHPFSCLGFILTLFYNGKRGKQNKLLNYLIYPIHLLIIGIIKYILL